MQVLNGQTMKRTWLYMGLVSVAIILAGCVQSPRTSILGEEALDLYTYASVEERAERTLPKKLMSVTFSGGGMRAAALAYGALTALRDTVSRSTNTPERHLIDEIDIVSAVSGGSVTAAYWALEGANGLEGLKNGFLKENVQRELIWKIMKPTTLVQLMTPSYARGDVLRDFFDTELFKKARYGDLLIDGSANRHVNGRPYLILNAMNMNSNGTFAFTQRSFNFLCADLAQFKLADAVAASAAYPGWFTAVPLKNHIQNTECPPKNTTNAANRRDMLTSWITGEHARAQKELKDAIYAADRATTRKNNANQRLGDARVTNERRKSAVDKANDKVSRLKTEQGKAAKERENRKTELEAAETGRNNAKKVLEKARSDKQRTIVLYEKLKQWYEKQKQSLSTDPTNQQDTPIVQDEPTKDSVEDLQNKKQAIQESSNIDLHRNKMRMSQMRSWINIFRARVTARQADLYSAEKKQIGAENRENIAAMDEKQVQLMLDDATTQQNERHKEYELSIKDLAEAERELDDTTEREREANNRKKDTEQEASRIKGLNELLTIIKQLEVDLERDRLDYREENYSTVHLLDGGIADNLGLSPLLELLYRIVSVKKEAQKENILDHIVDQIIVIMVDAGTRSTQDFGRKSSPPNLIDTLTTAVGASINSKSVLLRDKLESLTSTLHTAKIKIRVVYVDFAQISQHLAMNGHTNDALTGKLCERRFHKIPTNWKLDSSVVESLIQLGSALVRESTEYKEFTQEIGFEIKREKTISELCERVARL